MLRPVECAASIVDPPFTRKATGERSTRVPARADGTPRSLRTGPARNAWPARTVALGLVAGGSAQQSADRLAKVRHTAEG